MQVVIDKLVEIVSKPPDPVLAASSVGARMPAAETDVPAIVVSLALEEMSGNGIGRLVHAGGAAAQHTVRVEVDPASGLFSSDLRTLRLRPLPVTRRPASNRPRLTADDLQVMNMTDPAQPRPYRMVEQPAQLDDFALGASDTQLVFGRPQVAGDQLLVAHWSTSPDADVLGDRFRGTLKLEIWAATFAEVDRIARRLHHRLASQPALLREKGYVTIQPATLDPARRTRQEVAVGSPFSIWIQTLGYRFQFAAEAATAAGSGPIARIDVDLTGHPAESFSIPEAP